MRLLATQVLLGQNKAREARAALAPVAYFVDEPVQSAVGQKVLAALDKDGPAAALEALTKAREDARKKEEGGDKKAS